MRDRRDDVDRLLLDGVSIASPGPDLLELAQWLQTLELVRIDNREFVRCANPEDRDFPPYNRHCRGRVYLEATLDEPGHDYKCPDCERAIFPFRARKRRHQELQVSVLEAGVLSYIGSRLSAPEELARGVFQTEHDGSYVDVCVIEACDDARYLSPYWNSDRPTLYVAIQSGGPEGCLRNLRQNQLLLLADLLCDVKTLPTAIQGLLDGDGAPATGTLAGSSVEAKPLNATGPVFRPPRTILFRSVEHDCSDLTRQQIAFLRIAMRNAETQIGVLMHRGDGAVWKDRYTGAEAQRGRISQLVSRVNRKLSECSPPLGISFSLRSGEHSITRLVPRLADKEHLVADNPLTKD